MPSIIVETLSEKAHDLLKMLEDLRVLRIVGNTSSALVPHRFNEQYLWDSNRRAKDAFEMILQSALNNIEPGYFSNINNYDAAISFYLGNNSHIELDAQKIKSLKDHLQQYQERVFCYELYHQMRRVMDGRFEGLKLQSEVRKGTADEIIASIINVRRLEKEYQPDFLLHAPHTTERQLVVMEVKTNPKLTFKGAMKDLLKIQEFIDRYRYQMGVFLTVNSDWDRFLGSIRTESTGSWIRANLQSRDNIYIACKEGHGVPWLMRSIGDLVGD